MRSTEFDVINVRWREGGFATDSREQRGIDLRNSAIQM